MSTIPAHVDAFIEEFMGWAINSESISISTGPETSMTYDQAVAYMVLKN